ncbi:MAG TPA: efflux RND transporter periplasmic adaptor subunit, partial [Fimbriimonadaceae bacterium]|nr:efflux RND transporter periplasmic adaptor subunit [Fimbriimonadaceae bacterium]
RVDSVLVDRGEVVRKGQGLAVVKQPEAAGAQSDVAAARAILIQAEANRQRAMKAAQLARQNLARQEEFAKAGAFSQPGLATARREFQGTEREVRDAQSVLNQAIVKHEAHEREYLRIKQLFADKLASRRDLEEAELEDKLDEEAIVQARSRLAAAERQHQVSKQEVAREEKLVKDGLYNRREIEVARAEVNRAEGELRASETEIRGARATVDAALMRAGSFGGQGGRVSLVSPISGTVVMRDVNQNEAVEPGRTLIEVVDTSEVWVHVDLFEKDIASVSLGMPVDIRTDSNPDRVFRGNIAAIGKVVDAEKRTTQVRIRVDNESGSLRQNEFATALILTDGKSGVLSIPVAAVQDLRGQKVAFVEMTVGFRATPIKVGTTQLGRVQVIKGLKPRDRVAVQGAYQLRMMAASQ